MHHSGWSENSKSSLRLTCHFIEGVVTKNHPLETKFLDERHTGDSIRIAVTEIFDNWGIILFQIVNSVTEDASNMRRNL